MDWTSYIWGISTGIWTAMGIQWLMHWREQRRLDRELGAYLRELADMPSRREGKSDG